MLLKGLRIWFVALTVGMGIKVGKNIELFLKKQ